MFLSFVKRWCVGSVFLCLSALAFSGCAVTSSGNMLGDAAVLKYSSDQKKFRYVEAGGVTVGAVTLTSIAAALILGILVNLVLKESK